MRWFWLIWISTTAAAAIGIALAIRPAAAARSREATKRPTSLILVWREAATPRAVAASALLAVFLTSYIAMILVWEDFSYYDNESYTLFTLKGHDIPLYIWRSTARFYPLTDQEFNLIRHLTDTNYGYHALPIVQLVIFFCILLTLDDELNITSRAILAILALLTPSILTSFSGLIFSERGVLFFLVFLVLCVKRFEQSQTIAWAVAAVVSAQILIYYKETASLLLFGFAIVRLILRCKNEQHGGWDYDRLWDKESRLDLCFVLMIILFLLYYLATIGFPGNTSYSATSRQPLEEIILGYIRIDLLAWLFVPFVLGRMYLILRRRAALLLLWDGLALGGLVYFIAYLYLSIFGIYYLAPVDLIAVLYIGRFVILSWKELQPWGMVATLLLAFTVLLQDISVSAFAVFERKNVIHGKAAIASAVEMRYRNGVGNAPRLFFPFTNPYTIMEFAAYLTYRGVPVEGMEDATADLDSVVLAARDIAENGPCVFWVRIRCHPANGPSPGDLVIVLPDDPASLAEASVYRGSGEGKLLFSYEPRPAIPDWVRSLFDSLHIASTRQALKTNPDRWMDGSVTLWN